MACILRWHSDHAQMAHGGNRSADICFNSSSLPSCFLLVRAPKQAGCRSTQLCTPLGCTVTQALLGRQVGLQQPGASPVMLPCHVVTTRPPPLQPDLLALDAEDSAAEKVRRQQRMEHIKRVEEENAIRIEPMGMDRRHNRYWRFMLRGAEKEEPGARLAGRRRQLVQSLLPRGILSGLSAPASSSVLAIPAAGSGLCMLLACLCVWVPAGAGCAV
jgi:hypothetical protein